MDKLPRPDFGSLYDRLMLCAASGRPLPVWLVAQLETGFSAYFNGEKKDLAELFGIDFLSGRNAKVAEHAKRLTIGGQIYDSVSDLLSSGEPLTTRKAFAVVAAHLDVSAGYVKNVYYAEKAARERPLNTTIEAIDIDTLANWRSISVSDEESCS